MLAKNKIYKNIYLLLTEFEVCTVSYGSSFSFSSIYRPGARAWAINGRGKNDDQ